LKPSPFNYYRAESVSNALALLKEHGDDAQILAGGQSLMAMMNLRLLAPEALIDINSIEELSGINQEDGVIRIGALTRHSEVEQSDLIAQHLPLLKMAIGHVGHAAIRNRGTLGGSISLADPAAEMPACAIALNAEIEIQGSGGTRHIAANDFFHGLFETERQADELLTAVHFPLPASENRSAFIELARRHGDYALVGVAVHGPVTGGTFGDLRIVYFGVGDKAVLATNAAQALEGQSLNDETLSRAQEALNGDLDPSSDLHGSAEFKSHLARVLLGRALKQLTD
jgi:aerobic carbon-monoxide dehydrogenase medium subunit